MTHPSPNELVTEFHETYGMPVNPHPTPTVNYERIYMRYNLIAEEFVELTEALFGTDTANEIQSTILDATNYEPVRTDSQAVVEAADALADLVYVIYGAALESSIPLDDVLQEVQRSNMSKLPPCADCDGEGYQEPEVNEEQQFAVFPECATCQGSGDGPPLRREDGKILKGERFSEPNIPAVLGL